MNHDCTYSSLILLPLDLEELSTHLRAFRYRFSISFPLHDTVTPKRYFRLDTTLSGIAANLVMVLVHQRIKFVFFFVYFYPSVLGLH